MKRLGPKRSHSAAHKKSGSRAAIRSTAIPKTPDDLYAMPKSAQDDWDRTIEGVYTMRLGHSARRAAQIVGLPHHKFLRLARKALTKKSNGRYRAKRVDRLLRVLSFPTRKGTQEIAVRDSREASKLAKYWEAVHRFTDGDARRLREFRGEHIIDANGVRQRLLTNLVELDRLANAGGLSFESLYRRR